MRVEFFINEYFRLLVNEMRKKDEFVKSLNDLEITKEEEFNPSSLISFPFYPFVKFKIDFISQVIP